MIQDIITLGIVAFCVLLVVRSIIGFFIKRMNSDKAGSNDKPTCGTCNSVCPMKGVMNTIEGNAKEIDYMSTDSF